MTRDDASRGNKVSKNHESNDNNAADDERRETFEAQLEDFLKKISLTDDEIKTRYEPVCEAIAGIFRPIYPKCVARCFGSTGCGLGLKNSDLDIHLSPGIPISFKDTSDATHMVKFSRLFSVVRRKLLEFPELFTNVVPIYTAKVPIIKFIYVPTNVSCDLSFGSCLGVYNTQLIRTYLSSDPKFLPAMLIIKHWINVITGGDLKVCMSKYALTILFIFYLQHLGLVPPVSKLKESFQNPVRIQGWQIYYDRGVQDFQAVPSNFSIPELLHGFFVFYSKYDFANNSICIDDGKSYDRGIAKRRRNVLLNALLKQDNQVRSKEDIDSSTWATPMFIQDPIDLSANVAKNIKFHHLENFQFFCSATADVIEQSSRNNYTDMLSKMFDLEDKQPIRNCETFFFDVPMKVLNNEDCQDVNNVKRWFEEIFESTKRFLEEVLYFNVEFIRDKEALNQYNLKVFASDNVNEQNVTTLHCKGSRQMWIGREKYTNNNAVFENILEKDIFLSKSMLEKSNASDAVVVDFIFQFIEIADKYPLQVCFKVFNRNTKEKVFHSLAQYLNLKMTSVLKKTFNWKHQFQKVNKNKKVKKVKKARGTQLKPSDILPLIKWYDLKIQSCQS